MIQDSVLTEEATAWLNLVLPDSPAATAEVLRMKPEGQFISTKIGSRLIPVRFVCTSKKRSSMFGIGDGDGPVEHVMRGFFMVGHEEVSCGEVVDDKVLSRVRGIAGREATVRDLIEVLFSIEPLSPAAVSALRKRVLDVSIGQGVAYDLSGDVLIPHGGFFGTHWKSRVYRGRRVIAESVLETGAEEAPERAWYLNMNQENPTAPMVRVFLLEDRVYAYAHLDDLTVSKWNDQMDKDLLLPDRHRKILDRVLSRTASARGFADLFPGRSGGLVIMAAGSPGTGKTLSAEVLSEKMHRPLYVVRMADLSLDPEYAEKEIKLIFKRAVRWGAIPLLDECEILLRKRSPENREQAALVGVFLRIMDTFEGTLFMTTNYPSAIDEAIRSRVTVTLFYADLDRAARAGLWGKMISRAGLVVTGGMDEVFDMPMNGRQIRSAVRMASLVAAEGAITSAEFVSVVQDVVHVESIRGDEAAARKGAS